MRALLLPFALLALCGAADEDAAHRADRLRTQALNRATAAGIARRDDDEAAAVDRYCDAHTAYERRLAAWRRQVAACEAGDDGACGAR